MKAKKDWKKIISDQQTSNLTVAAYCRTHQLSPASFYNNKKKLFESVTFLEIIPSSDETESKLSLSINDIRLEVDSNISKVNLAKILKALLHD